MSVDPWKTPEIDVETIEDLSAASRCDEGFLRVRRLRLRNHYPDGTVSASYRYDVVERDALDAVVLVLYSIDSADADGVLVCLRSSLRPPLRFREGYRVPIPGAADPVLWELPAGLVEADESGLAGLRACSARETLEETGLRVPASEFERLGPAVYLTPGVLAEQVHFFSARVEPGQRGEPLLDGSPVEENAVVRFVPIAEALAACVDGRIADSKTELGLRRLDSARAEGLR
jgi:ADP-ribose pyrophosphatase